MRVTVYEHVALRPVDSVVLDPPLPSSFDLHVRLPLSFPDFEGPLRTPVVLVKRYRLVIPKGGARPRYVFQGFRVR